jgi:hypothetical protein
MLTKVFLYNPSSLKSFSLLVVFSSLILSFCGECGGVSGEYFGFEVGLEESVDVRSFSVDKFGVLFK